MDPRSVFGDASVADWVATLCCALIEHKSHIEDKLSRERRLSDFCREIARWRADCLGGRQPLEGAASRLFDVCSRFGVIDWLRNEGAVAGRGTTLGKEPVRTQGGRRARREAHPPAKQPGAIPEQIFDQVAQVFTSTSAAVRKGG